MCCWPLVSQFFFLVQFLIKIKFSCEELISKVERCSLTNSYFICSGIVYVKLPLILPLLLLLIEKLGWHGLCLVGYIETINFD